MQVHIFILPCLYIQFNMSLQAVTFNARCTYHATTAHNVNLEGFPYRQTGRLARLHFNGKTKAQSYKPPPPDCRGSIVEKTNKH